MSEANAAPAEPSAQVSQPVGDDGSAATSGQAPASEMVRIGEHEIPVELLNQLPDDALAKIKRKVKAAGEEREVSLADALASYPKAADYVRKTQQLSEQRQQVETFWTAIQSDPVGAMAHLLGSEERVYQAVADRLEYAGMSPEQRTRMDEERELRRKAQLAEEYERRERDRIETAQVAQARQRFERDIGDALKAEGVRVSPFTVGRAAMVMAGALENSAEITPSEAAKIIAQETATEFGSRLELDDDEALIAAVGEERAKRIARAIGARVQRQASPPKAPVHHPSNDNGRRRSWDEIRAELEERDRKGRW